MRSRRPVALLSLVAGGVAALGLVAFAANGIAQAIDSPSGSRSRFPPARPRAATSLSASLLAQLLSHPPGVGRCRPPTVCGPAGLIVSTRASEGSIANVTAVNAGNVSSGIAQTDVVALAVAGKGPFARTGPAKQLRVIANLYGEDLHLLAAKNANIKSVADLRGKRVSLSSEGSGTINTARAILAAYRLTERTIVPNYELGERATDLLQSGKLDAMFYVGGTPAGLIEQLLDEGVAVLVPINGDARTRLLRAQPHLYAHTIPQGTYSGSGDVETVAVDALWITDASQPDNLIYGVAKSLFNPANRTTLNAERVGAHFIELRPRPRARPRRSIPAPRAISWRGACWIRRTGPAAPSRRPATSQIEPSALATVTHAHRRPRQPCCQ